MEQGGDIMEKITRFKDIKQFTTDGNYNVCYPLPSLVKYIAEEIEDMGLQLEPEFQRGHVWNEQQQVAWLEYHLRGGKSGNTIYLNLEFPQFYPQPPDFIGTIINNFQKMPKI